MTLLSNRTRTFFSLLAALVGCAPMSHPMTDAGGNGEPDAVLAPDAAMPPDARVETPDAAMVDAATSDAYTTDVPRLSYTRDVRPVLEASRCGECHAMSAVEMSYAWISARGTSWCRPETDPSYGETTLRRNCFEEHARTQTGDTSGQSCGSDFYHRHGEPCFTAIEQATVLAWAAGGYAE